MNPARIPDLPALGQEDSLLRTIIWIVLYVLCVGGAVIYVIHKLPHRDDGPDGEE